MALDARGNIFLTGLTPTAVSPAFADRAALTIPCVGGRAALGCAPPEESK
jgi:hypothetical protein